MASCTVPVALTLRFIPCRHRASMFRPRVWFTTMLHHLERSSCHILPSMASLSLSWSLHRPKPLFRLLVWTTLCWLTSIRTSSRKKPTIRWWWVMRWLQATSVSSYPTLQELQLYGVSTPPLFLLRLSLLPIMTRAVRVSHSSLRQAVCRTISLLTRGALSRRFPAMRMWPTRTCMLCLSPIC